MRIGCARGRSDLMAFDFAHFALGCVRGGGGTVDVGTLGEEGQWTKGSGGAA